MEWRQPFHTFCSLLYWNRTEPSTADTDYNDDDDDVDDNDDYDDYYYCNVDRNI